jgi:Tol biopolymer transport system component
MKMAASRFQRSLGAGFVALVSAVAWATPSLAQTSPEGRIAFNSYKSGDGDIYVVNADGTGESNVTGAQPLGEGHDDQGPDWSPNGQQIAFTRYRFNEGADVFVINPDGSGLRAVTEEQGTFERPILNSQPDWAPDGSKLAFGSNREGNLEIWLIDLDGTDAEQLTFTSPPARNIQPSWSPDGSKLAFVSTRGGGGQDVFVMSADGTGVDNLTDSTSADTNYWHPTWSPTGESIAYTRTDTRLTPEESVSQSDIWISNPSGEGAVNVTDSPANEYNPSFSPDGSQISFAREDAEGNTDIWIMDVPAGPSSGTLTMARMAAVSAGTKITSHGTAGQPDWSGSGSAATCMGLQADNEVAGGLIEGTANRDVLVGSAGANTIRGFGGDDVICGRGGQDTAVGGAGNDSLLGQGGEDTLRGGAGRDDLVGGKGSDSCAGGSGTDTAANCETTTGVP